MSLRLRLALLFALVVATGIGIASWAAFVTTSNELESEIDSFLQNRATEIADGARALPDRRGNDRDLLSQLAVDADSVIQLLNKDGVVIGREGGSLPVDATDVQLSRFNDAHVLRTVDVDGADFRIITQHIPGTGAVQVGRDLTETRSVVERLGTSLVGVGVLLSVLAAAAGWFVARGTTRPLRRLSAAAEEIAQTQDLTTKIPVEGRDEVGRLAMSIDTMIEALATSRDQQHRLVMDAGHELRTPLTSLRANVEFLQRAPDVDPAQRAAAFAAIGSEVEELSSLVTELIELATDTRDDDEPFERLDLGHIVDGAVERIRRRTGRLIDLEADDSFVLGRPALLDRAVANLLANANKFSPSDQGISVVVSAGRVAVRDRGPGIEEQDLPSIFDRFYRATATRSEPGSGLGLAIVSQVAERHRGTVFATNCVDGGAEVGFTLPLVD